MSGDPRNPRKGPHKELCITTDIGSDLSGGGRPLTERNLDELMGYCASLGATRHEWIFDSFWAAYSPDATRPFDLLGAACAAAHRHGMRFDIVFKPFEGALSGPHAFALPPTMPRPEGVPWVETLDGLLHCVRPFNAAHPELCMARRPESDPDPGGRIAAVRLVKNDDAPVSFASGDFSLWTSPRNGGFRRYEGPVVLNESLAWRASFPYTDRLRRVISLEGLTLPTDTRYILVRRERTGGEGTFANARNELVELTNDRGADIPVTPAFGRVDGAARCRWIQEAVARGLTPYMRHEEVREWVGDGDRLRRDCDDMFTFYDLFLDAQFQSVELSPGAEFVVARGKERCVPGHLHPIYPAVRNHWLEEIRQGIDRGVDGVNIRLANHVRPIEPWSYGFNEPVLDKVVDRENVAEARRVNGKAYTTFLAEAAELLHRETRQLGVHVHANLFGYDERHPGNFQLPANMDWHWEDWVRDLADYVELRGSIALRPRNLRHAADRLALAAREAGIPCILQSLRGRVVLRSEGPFPSLANELDGCRRHPGIAVYNLYESAYFIRFDQGHLAGSPDIRSLIGRYWEPGARP